MAVSSWQNTITQTASFTHQNSGFSPTTVAGTGNAFTQNYAASGLCYLNQTPVTATVSVDFVSGGLKDLAGDTINFQKITSLQVMPTSGAIQVETIQSGGIKLPQLGLSGGGLLIDVGAAFAYGTNNQQLYSGYALNLSATNGNLVFRAVSGNCLLSIGAYGY